MWQCKADMLQVTGNTVCAQHMLTCHIPSTSDDLDYRGNMSEKQTARSCPGMKTVGANLSGVSGSGDFPKTPLALSFSVKSTNTRSTFSSGTNMSMHCPKYVLVTPPTAALCAVMLLLGKVSMNQRLTLPAKDRWGLS